MFGSCNASVSCDVSDNEQIELNTDIIGLGVLIAFIITGLFTFAVVFIAYFTDTLPGSPDTYLTWADQAFLKRWRWCRGCRTDGNSRPCHHTNPELNKKYRDGMTAVILSLSDQQLVTGPAMLIAGLLQDCSLSCYEFSVLANLGWLSSVTHLSTLILLREYLQKNKRIRDIRVLLIVCNWALLLYVLGVSAFCTDQSPALPLQCIAKIPHSSLSIATLVLNILIVALPYYTAILQLYFEDDTLVNWFLKNVLFVISHKPAGMTKADFDQWYRSHIWESSIRPGSRAYTEDQLQRIYNRGPKAPILSKIVKSLAFGLLALASSYWLSLLGILYQAAVAIGQLVVVRSKYTSNVKSENTIDFGQLVPLFLLALPILAAIEAYYDITSEKKRQSLAALLLSSVSDTFEETAVAKENLTAVHSKRPTSDDQASVAEPIPRAQTQARQDSTGRTLSQRGPNATRASNSAQSDTTVTVKPEPPQTQPLQHQKDVSGEYLSIFSTEAPRKFRVQSGLDEVCLNFFFVFTTLAFIGLGGTMDEYLVSDIIILVGLLVLFIVYGVYATEFSWKAMRRCRHIKDIPADSPRQEEKTMPRQRSRQNEPGQPRQDGAPTNPDQQDPARVSGIEHRTTASLHRNNVEVDHQPSPSQGGAQSTQNGDAHVPERRMSLHAIESNVGL